MSIDVESRSGAVVLAGRIGRAGSTSETAKPPPVKSLQRCQEGGVLRAPP
jgi:hypothetical protein